MNNLHNNGSHNNDNSWTMDKIIQIIFPILGVIMIVAGLGYFFYTGFWEQVGAVGRIALGFLTGSLMIAGGHTFQHKLKNFSDAIIGGGILMLYVTLIYGSRFEFSQEITSGILPESITLLIAVFFAMAIAFYAKQRNSKTILTLGIIGAYTTPFFIGQADGFETSNPYQISYIQFLFYFLTINISLFVASFKMNVFSLISLNSFGLFFATLSISGLIGNGIAENPILIPILLFLITAFQLLFTANYFSKFNTSKYSFGFSFISPFIYIVSVLFVAIGSSSVEVFPEISLISLLMFGISALYFYIWNILNTQYTSLYVLGILSATIAFLNISDIFDGYMGIIISTISFIFALLYSKAPKISREIAFLCTSVIGVMITTEEVNMVDGEFLIFSYGSLFLVFSLLPFLAHFFMKKTNIGLYELRSVLAYLASFLIIVILGADIVEDIEIGIDIIIGIIPSAVFAVLAYFKKEDEKILKYSYLSLIFLLIGYISSFFVFWDKLFPAHSDLPFSSKEGVIGGGSLIILLILSKKIKTDLVFSSLKKISGFYFLVASFTVLVAFQFVSYEIISIYNVLVEPSPEMIYLDSIKKDTASIVGLRAILISFWWVGLASLLIFLGIKNSEKFMNEKKLGMIVLIFALGKIVFYDISHLDTNLKVLLFIITGVSVLGLSYVLNKNKNHK